ncbi:MAG TPA: class I SAM-dependent methyltransferase [Sulfurovum sp.]|nr:MAG: methyltransferase [Sulfurovum sp. 35-42-20]OYZ24556.1 MAG: methyltransferase [Sulfurovum sp. 16-42-52]OZA44619.1 MAG: methyltransferase [Sulfurovum sp. 17-42-90]OZA60674.1 MAG: methyltransferase [Sulfurovum sp. 39-42-12]HQT29438.1 class I SAM-dependent methyltransferase [Sulfurovum sp.]
MLCSICHHEMHSFCDAKTAICYYQCSHCDFLCKSAEHHQDLNTQKSRYTLHQNDENNAGYQAYFQRFLDFVLPLVGNPKNALDFGCGASTLLAKMLKENGIPCDYYDPLFHPQNTIENKKYQLIVSTEVFEHLHQPKEVFDYLLQRLEKGGYLALQTQFHPNDIQAFFSWYYHQDPTHIVFFTVKTFSVLCEAFGCKMLGDNQKNIVVIRKNKELV